MHSMIIILATICCSAWAQRAFAPQVAGKLVQIISQTNDVGIDGSYKWSFEADNGIAAQETGQLKSADIEEAQGSFKYTAPDGSAIQLQYIANELGFQPQGAHLPVPPPIPPEILKGLEWNAAHPEEDDGVSRPGAGFRG